MHHLHRLITLSTLLLLLLLLHPLSATIPPKPSDRCNGQKMYYTPLIDTTTSLELGVCDSSCHPILPTTPDTVPARTDAKSRRYHKRRLANPPPDEAPPIQPANLGRGRPRPRSAPGAFQRGYTCDETKTLPEDDLDPDEDGKRFPFHMRTCWTPVRSGRHLQQRLQRRFEVACNRAQGTFTNPAFRTWLSEDEDEDEEETGQQVRRGESR